MSEPASLVVQVDAGLRARAKPERPAGDIARKRPDLVFAWLLPRATKASG